MVAAVVVTGAAAGVVYWVAILGGFKAIRTLAIPIIATELE